MDAGDWIGLGCAFLLGGFLGAWIGWSAQAPKAAQLTHAAPSFITYRHLCAALRVRITVLEAGEKTSALVMNSQAAQLRVLNSEFALDPLSRWKPDLGRDRMSFISQAAAIIRLQWDWNHRRDFPAAAPPPPPPSPVLVLNQGSSAALVNSNTSSDAVAWADNVAGGGGATFTLYGFNNPTYYGWDGSGYYTSIDGATWTPSPVVFVGGGTQQISRAKYSGTQWVGINFATNEIYSSPDAITWTKRVNPNPNMVGDDLVWSTTFNKWVVVGQESVLGADNACSSPDGITWTTIPKAASASPWESLRGACQFGGQTIIMGNRPAAAGAGFWTSADGVTWALASTTVTTQFPIRPAVGVGAAVACRNSTRAFFRTVDGVTWANITPPLPGAGGSNIAITYHNSWFVSTYSHGEIYKSTDEGATFSIVALLAPAVPWNGVT